MDLHIDEHDALDEQLESIPWSDLVTQRRPFPRWVAYVAAGVLAMAALGVVVARAVPGGSRAPSEAAPRIVSTTSPVVSTVVPTIVSTTAPLYSEADLMALVPGSQEQLAAARAEWFVRDYFGSGGRPDEVPGVMAALPDGAEVPTGGGTGVSYVEWARSAEIRTVGPDLFRATVVFGMLAGPDAQSLIRLPVRAAYVVIEVREGKASVVDLPSPAPIPADAGVAPWPEGEEELPRSLFAVVEEEAGGWGSDPKVISAVRATGGWRVVVTVADTTGNRWPLSLWMDDSTVLDAPPWDVDG